LLLSLKGEWSFVSLVVALAVAAWLLDRQLSDSLGIGAMQRHVSAEKYHKVAVDGGMQVQQDGGMPYRTL
jgi:hypothetical protein